MHRQILNVAAAFLVGALAGAMAVGGQGTRPESQSARPSAPAPSADTEQQTPVAHTGPQQGVGGPLGTLAVSGAAPEDPPGPVGAASELEAQFQAMTAGWSRLEEELGRLRGRVDGLESRLGEVAATERDEGPGPRPRRPMMPDERRSALVKAGVAEDLAADLIWRRGQVELDHLDLRDVAMREGWFGSDRYREELRRIDEQAPRVRREIGDEAYDRYLFETGENNRVSVASIIPGSVAEEVGLRPGDIVEAYGDTRVFTFSELRAATREGERDEPVRVQIRRDDGVVEAWLSRGPLGVRLDLTRADPDA